MGTNRKMTEAEEEYIRQSKQRGRQRKNVAALNRDHVAKPCRACGATTHTNTRSGECPFHIPSTQESLDGQLGVDREDFTVTCNLDTIIKVQYRDVIRAKVQEAVRYSRSVVVRTMVLVNTLILVQDNVADIVFTPNFFYSAMQVVLGRTITNTNSLIPKEELNAIWATLANAYPTLGQPLSTFLGRSSNILADACVQLATSYANHIVENFQSRICGYIQRQLLLRIPVRKAILRSMAF